MFLNLDIEVYGGRNELTPDPATPASVADSVGTTEQFRLSNISKMSQLQKQENERV